MHDGVVPNTALPPKTPAVHGEAVTAQAGAQHLGGKFEVAFAGLSGAADFGFDSKRKRVLVPRFLDNAVEIYDLK